MAKKDELLEIARRFPEEIERVAKWESIAARGSKRSMSTMFEADTIPGNSRKNEEVTHETHGIKAVIEWARTSRGGRQFDLFRGIGQVKACSSLYGLCE